MIATCSIDDLDLFKPGPEADHLARHWGCSPLSAAVLKSRGVSAEKAEALLAEPDLSAQLGRLNLGNQAETVNESWQKAVKGRVVLAYGDYDVDGVSATVIALELARASGAARTHYYIPRRTTEGYGLHCSGVEAALSAGVETLLVVDCGTRDVEAIEAAKAAGLTVFIFDHHLVEGEAGRPHGLINPQLDGDDEAKKLCAAGVVWCWAARSGLFPSRLLDSLVQLAGMATVADCMPLGPLNRELTRRGLEVLRRSPYGGMKALIDALEVNLSSLDEETLAMRVIPCLNASGRLQAADLSVDVVAALGDLNANVERLVALNKKRKDLSNQIAQGLSRRLETDESIRVFYDGSWPVGILSGIASRLCHERGHGFALCAPSAKGIRGTLRVPEGANAVEILRELSPHLEAWGGHRYAAGFSVKSSQWPRVSMGLSKLLEELEPAPERHEAILFDPAQIEMNDLSDLNRLGPFGNGNPAPAFFVPRRDDSVYEPLGKQGLHLKINRKDHTLLAFRGARQIQECDHIAGWIYRPRLNVWRGRRYLQFVVDKIVLG